MDQTLPINNNQNQQHSTQRLYYQYPDRMLFKAKVIGSYEEKTLLEKYPFLNEKIRSLKNEKTNSIHALILDRTLFFPAGGGQKADQGVIESEKITTEVLSTIEAICPSFHEKILPKDWINSPILPPTLPQKERESEDSFETGISNEEGEILHLVDRLIPIGTEITGHLDQGNRKDYQQQHSAQHLISSAAFHSLGINTLSIHLGEKESTIDFDRKDIPLFDLTLLENEANLLCKKNLKITSTLYEQNQFDITKLRRKPKKNFHHLRVVEIENYDLSPCCGVHCLRTGLVSPIFILGKEKIKDKTRITFIAGDRAIKAFHDYKRTINHFSKEFSMPFEALSNLPAQIQDQKGKQKKTELFLAQKLIEKIIKTEERVFNLCDYEALGTARLKNFSDKLAKELSNLQKEALILIPAKENWHWIILDFEANTPTRFDSLKKAFDEQSIQGGGRFPRYEGFVSQKALLAWIDRWKQLYLS